MEIKIREIKLEEYIFLKEMLYEAIFIPENQPKFLKTIVDKPELNKYFSDFGRKGDHGLVAESENTLVGAIWVRQFNDFIRGYAYVDAQTPELSMAVNETFRNKGIGQKLLSQILIDLTEQGIQKVSLSVDYRNYAKNFYSKNGFEEVKTVFTAVLMIKNLA